MIPFAALICSSYATTTIACNQQQLWTADDMYSIQSCYFFGFYNSNLGGAIYICSNNSNLAAKSSIFSACGANNTGGAFYFKGTNADMERICGSDCYTSYTAQFFYAYLTGSSTSTLLESSMLRCSNSTVTGPYDCFHIWYGNQTISNFNSTMNQVTNWGSGFLPCYASQLDSIFVTVANCSGGSGSGGVIEFYHTTTGLFSYSNVIYNNGTTIVCDSGTTNISMSVFIGNSGNLFVGGTISKCWIAHTGTIGGLSVINCSYATASTLQFSRQSQAISGFVCYIQPASHAFSTVLFSRKYVKYDQSLPMLASFSMLLISN